MEARKSGDSGITYVFGPFRLVPGECLLLRNGEPVTLTPQAFDLLCLLVESAGHLQSREELIEALWPTTVVEENGLPWNVSAVRKALGDSSDAPRYIETVRGRGYRFIAPVGIEDAGRGEGRGNSPARGRFRWAWVVAAGLAVAVAVALFMSWPTLFRESDTAVVDPPPHSIAVLPFENLNVGDEDAYFVAGMQDLILTKLAGIDDLRVISRSSTLKYRSHPRNLRLVARQLGVATILEGSVQKHGDQVLVDVQLIDARTDTHLWAHSYQRTLANVFGVEGEVAARVAAALKAEISSGETKRLATELTGDPVADDLFLRAEYLAERGFSGYDPATLRQAVSTYRKAVARAPDFALAWARLSYTESLLAWIGARDLKALEAKARSDAGSALELAPNLAAAHLALGYSDYFGRSDFAAAQKAFSAALALRPNDARALAARGSIARRQGHFGAAIAFFRKALMLDPRNAFRAWELGQTYTAVNRYADAERLFRRALALDPDNLMAKWSNADAILYESGNVSRALRAARGDAPALELRRADYLRYERRYREALALLEGVPNTPDNFRPSERPKALRRADLYRRMGDTDHADPLFEQALAESREQLKRQHGIRLSAVWQNIAAADIGLGRIPEALDAIGRARSAFAKTDDRYTLAGYLELDAALYAKAGRPDLAVPVLARALAMPGIGVVYSPVMLWIDPSWDRIRHDARFRALLEKYAKFKPRAAAVAAALTGNHE